MMLVKIMFYILAAVALGSALFVASSKNLVRSVFMFFITLFALAGLYVLALADFVAITQIVIYVGGILVLILFAFMLSGRETLDAIQQQKSKLINLNKLPAIVLAALFFVVMFIVLRQADVDKLDWVKVAVAEGNVIKPDGIQIENIGVNLMTGYLLPFEVISILLMIALIGAAHLSRKEQEA